MESKENFLIKISKKDCDSVNSLSIFKKKKLAFF